MVSSFTHICSFILLLSQFVVDSVYMCKTDVGMLAILTKLCRVASELVCKT